MREIWQITINQIQRFMSNKTGLSMLMIFPIFLIWILGTALSGVFGNNLKLDQLTVLYSNQAETPLGRAFVGFVAEGKKLGIKFIPVKTTQVALARLKKNQATCYLRVINSGQDGKLEFYQNQGAQFEVNLVKSTLEPFLQRYNALLSISQINPQVIPKLLQEPARDYVQTRTLTKKREPRAMDYYAVTMLTLMLLYGGFLGVMAVHQEKTRKTVNRLLASPISIMQIMSGKTLGCLLITLLQAVILIFFSKYVLNTYWGSHFEVVLLLIISEVIMVVSLGLGVGLLAKNEAIATVILQMLISVLGFLGGSYVSIDDFSKAVLKVAEFSPIRWMNRALFQVIYSQDFSSVPTTILINLCLTIFFTGMVCFFLRKGGLQT